MPAEHTQALAAASNVAAELYDRFQTLRSEKKMRHRDAAHALGVSEAEAIASAVGRRDGLSAARLKGPWPNVFEQVPLLGTVLALTRNESVVHEKVGQYGDMSHTGMMGLALGKAIDLRIFYARWKSAYAVIEETPKGLQRSLQIYDAHGTAVHKVFLRAESDLDGWMALVDGNLHDDQQPGVVVTRDRPAIDDTDDSTVNVPEFHAAWADMKDTHEFFPLLRRFKLARTQALRLADRAHAYRVANGTARTVLQDAARDQLYIMCFVGNPGMIQIHSGPVTRIEIMGDWLNVLDSTFNLHLREDRIAQTWVVRKPTSDGIVTSVELFDTEGETIAMFFGERKPGIPELEGWRALVGRIPAQTA